MPTVLLVANRTDDAQYSMLGFAGVLARELPGLGWSPTVIAPKTRLARVGRPHQGLGKWLAYVDKYVLFPRDLRRAAARFDLVHILDQGNGMYVPSVKTRPHLITLHDLLATRAALGELPVWKLSRTGIKYQQLILEGFRQSLWAACASEATLHDAMRLLAPTTNLRLVRNGFYHPCIPRTQAEADVILAGRGFDASTQFLLHVGGNQPTKNRIACLPIFAALRKQGFDPSIRLVFAGKPLPEAVQALKDELGLNEAVTEWADASRDELDALYSRAEALVFPSHHEGFGLPIIEAQACACPVFTTGRPPMNEVGGDAARYFDPSDPDGAASQILHFWSERETMRIAGKANIRRYDTAEMVSGYAALYSEILGAAR